MRRTFEHRYLSALVEWLDEQLNSSRANALLPVETSGANLLDALRQKRSSGPLPYLRVVSRHSLPYLTSEDRASLRPAVIDDTVRTGRSIAAECERLRTFGVRPVAALACFTAENEFTVGEGYPTEPRPASFATLSPRDYKDLLASLSSFSLRPRLPPEADHLSYVVQHSAATDEHLLTCILSLGDRASVWSAITAHEDSDGHLSGITMDFPRNVLTALLPGGHARPRFDFADGVVKLRLLMDERSGHLVAYPMVYPRLTLPGDQIDEIVGLKWGSSSVRMFLEVARDHAMSPTKEIAAEVIYRAITQGLELHLASSAAAHLQRTLGMAVQLAVGRDSVSHLFGASLQDAVERSISTELASSRPFPATILKKSGVVASPRESGSRRSADALSLVHTLRNAYREKNENVDSTRSRPARLSLGDLERNTSSALTHLRASRALDLALASGLIVPELSLNSRSGNLVVARTYRTTENSSNSLFKDGEQLENAVDYADETIAAIVHFISGTSAKFMERPIPALVLHKVIALLEPLLTELGVPLRAKPQTFGPVLSAVVDTSAGTSELFDFETHQAIYWTRSRPDGVVCTRDFLQRYAADGLAIQASDVLSRIQASLEPVVRAIDKASNHTDFLTACAMVQKGRLGLEYVRFDLERGLEVLINALSVCVRDLSSVNLKKLRKSVQDCEQYVGIARSKLTLLRSDWATQYVPPAFESQEDLRFRSRVIDTRSAAGIYEIGEFVSNLVSELARMLLAAMEEHAGVPQLLSAATENFIPASLDRLRVIGGALLGEGRLRSPGTPSVAALAQGILDISQTCRRIVHALAGDPPGLSLGPARVGLGSSRRRCVLFADLSGSTVHSATHGHYADAQWKNYGLNLVAAWGAAFGGREFDRRRGDDIQLEFITPEAALNCAWMLQTHLVSLAASGGYPYRFRIAIDKGEISHADGGNVIGAPIDRAAKLAKLNTQPENSKRVFFTSGVHEGCPAWLKAAAEVRVEASFADREDLADCSTFYELPLDATRAAFLANF